MRLFNSLNKTAFSLVSSVLAHIGERWSYVYLCFMLKIIRIFLLQVGSDFQSYNASRMNLLRQIHLNLIHLKSLYVSYHFSHKWFFHLSFGNSSWNDKKNPYSYFLIIEFYGKYFTQPCYAASPQRNTRKTFCNISHRTGSEKWPQ